MNKREVSGEYTFKTGVVDPRWLVRSIDEYNPMYDMTSCMVRLDHRFQVEGLWDWIACEAIVNEWTRAEMARLLRKMRKKILDVKRAKA